MAKSTRRRKGRRKGKRKSGQVPLKILQKRLVRLNGIVKRRGGDSY